MDVGNFKIDLPDLSEYSIIAGSDHGFLVYDFLHSEYCYIDSDGKISVIDISTNYAEFSDDSRLFFIGYNQAATKHRKSHKFRLGGQSYRCHRIRSQGAYHQGIDQAYKGSEKRFQDSRPCHIQCFFDIFFIILIPKHIITSHVQRRPIPKRYRP